MKRQPGIEVASINLGKTMAMENSFGATKKERKNLCQKSLEVTILEPKERKGEAWKVKRLLEEEGEGKVNNMYKGEQEGKQGVEEWKCPMCKVTGVRIGLFGICRESHCGGVRTEGTARDREEGKVRKVEVLYINEKGGGTRKTRIFWTDGSGKGR